MTAPERAELEALGLSATCAEVLRHLWDYLDDEIGARQGERLRAHLSDCTTCRSYEQFQTGFLDELARLRRQLDAPDEVRERVAARLRAEGCGCWESARRRRS